MDHDERTNCWGVILGIATCLWFTVQIWLVAGNILASFAVAIFVTPLLMMALVPVYFIAASLLALIPFPKKD